MNLQQYRTISPKMNEEITAIFTKFGFDVRSLRAGIDDRLGIVKLSIELGDKNQKDATGATVSPDAAYYREHVKMMGEFTKLKVEWLNTECRMGGETFRLVGMKRKGKNRMLILRIRDNSLRVTTEEQVVMFFGRAGIHPAENVGSTTDQSRGARPLGELLKEGK